jgi:hypothetical protein
MASTQGSAPHPGPASTSRQPLSGPDAEAFRAPLAAILGNAQYLKRVFLNGRPLPPDEYLAALARIERSVWALEGHLRVLEYDHHRSDLNHE